MKYTYSCSECAMDVDVDVPMAEYDAEKDYEGALAAFENGLAAENPSCRQSLMYNQIITYEFLNDYAKAAELMGVYLELYPGDETAVRENIFLSTR